MKKDPELERLKAELKEKDSELEKAVERLQDLEDSRKAMLYMLEDLNSFRKEILRSQSEWVSTVDAITDPLFIHDSEFRIVRANRAYAEAAGMKFKHLIGRLYYEVFPKMEGPFGMCRKTLELQEEEEEVLLDDKIYRVRSYAVRDAEGGHLYSVYLLEDITEFRRAEERIKEEMEITSNLLMIAEATAHTTDVNKLMGDVVKCGHRIMECDICLSYLWNEETGSFQPAQCYGLAHELLPLFRTERLAEEADFVKEVLDLKKTVILQPGGESEGPGGTADTPQPGPFPWIRDINTMVVIPLIGKLDTLGLLIGIYAGAESKTVPALPERYGRVMDGISQQVSTALHEARLYRDSIDKALELSHKVETIQVMHEIDRSILSTLEGDEVLDIAVRLVGRVVPCDGSIALLVDQEREGFIRIAGFGLDMENREFIPFKDTLGAEIVKTQRQQILPDLSNTKDLPSLEIRLLDSGFRSCIRVPLIAKGKVAAALYVGSKRPAAFTPGDLSTLEKLASQISIAMENARLVSDLKDLFLGTLKTLSSAIDAKSPWTAGHSERVTGYALLIGEEMGLSGKEMKDLELAGILHDIGKIGTYEAILDKPSKLTDEEFEIVKKHPGKGAELLEPIKQFKDITPAVRHHHEYYDGTGYPDRLRGEEIPLPARILAVADTFDAMKADRPYRTGRTMDFIAGEFRRCSGAQFDPKVVNVLLDILGGTGVPAIKVERKKVESI